MRKDGKELLFLVPVCKHNIWGGVKLREEFGYPVEGNDIGECWGISAHPEGDGTIRNGEYQAVRKPAVRQVSAVDEDHRCTG